MERDRIAWSRIRKSRGFVPAGFVIARLILPARRHQLAYRRNQIVRLIAALALRKSPKIICKLFGIVPVLETRRCNHWPTISIQHLDRESAVVCIHTWRSRHDVAASRNSADHEPDDDA